MHAEGVREACDRRTAKKKRQKKHGVETVLLFCAVEKVQPMVTQRSSFAP